MPLTGDLARTAGAERAVLVAVLELVDAAAWRDPARRAELRLELEEDLTAQARGRGRELGDGRREQTTYHRRHRYRDVATGAGREWLEVVPAAGAAHLVTVHRIAVAYRRRP